MGFFFFFFLIPAQTNDSQYKDILLSEENILTISNSKSWKRIINFDDENLAIERDKLYLSSQNDLDAKTELELTIKIYEDYLENKSDEICRFPARAFFVSHTFSDFPKFTAVIFCSVALKKQTIRALVYISTLRCLINVRRTFINIRVFSHQYFLIRDRTFINFESMISQTKIIVLFCKKKYSSLRVYSLGFFHLVLLFGPVRLLVF